MRHIFRYLFAVLLITLLPGMKAEAGMKFSKSEIKILKETKVNEVTARVVWQSYPREVHKNAKRDGHGNGAVARFAVIKTDRGEGIGLINKDDLTNIVFRGNFSAASRKKIPLAGRTVWELIDPETMLVSKVFAQYEMAVYDLIGVVLKKPFYELFGKPAAKKVVCYSGMIYLEDLEFPTKEEGIAKIIADCQQDYDLGYRHFKVKLGRGAKWMSHDEGLQRDIDVTQAIHKHFPDVTILVDPNDQYSLEDCITYLEGVKNIDLFWLEEPFVENLENYAALNEWVRKNMPSLLIADGEFDPQIEELDKLMKAGLVNVYCEDTNQFGYSVAEGQFAFTKWIERMPELKEMNVQASPHAWGSLTKTVYAAMLGLAFGNVPMIEGVTSTCSDLDYGFKLENGYFIPEGKPGFGITFKTR